MYLSKANVLFHRDETLRTTSVSNNFYYNAKLCVLDFEATCDEQKKIYPIEIIELPVLKINARTFQCESIFHTCL